MNIKLLPLDQYNKATIEQGHPQSWEEPSATEYDLIILGGGPAGIVAALTAVNLGCSVALIERRLTGGTCVNFGCTPSKALIRSARAFHEVEAGQKFGYELPDNHATLKFNSVMSRVRQIRSISSSLDSAQMLKTAGVDVYLRSGVFAGEQSIRVGNKILCFRKAFIATGSKPSAPDIPGLEEGNYYTNETIFSLEHLPARLAVLGGGPMGCELAQSFRRIGSSVDLVTSSDNLLPNDEALASQILLKAFQTEGIRTHSNFRAVKAENKVLYLEGAAGKKSIQYDALLMCIGRKPNIDELELEKARIETNEHGVIVNDFLETSNPNIYAIGDVGTSEKYTHTAVATAKLCVTNAFTKDKRTVSSLTIPHCTYTQPEVAVVGLTEQTAFIKNIEVERHFLSLEKIERAYIDGENTGFAALYTLKGSSQIVGATLVANHAGEMISELTLAVTNKMTMEALAETIHCYPTQAEVFQRIAVNYVS